MEIGRMDRCIDMFSKSKALGVLRDYLLSALDYSDEHLILNDGDLRVERKIDLDYGMFAIEQKYILGNVCFFESHRQYVDFQLIISGVEGMQAGDLDSFSVKSIYDENKDVALFEQKREVSKIIAYPRDLIVFLPIDVHRCGLKVEQNLSNIVFKSVVKVPHSLLKFRF